MPSRPMLLIIGTGSELTHRYMLEAAATEYPLLLIDTRAPTWQRPFVVDHETAADLHDMPSLTAAADRLAARWNVAGVLALDEYHLMAAARLAERLQLPGNTPTAVRAARDKATSRELFMASDVPSALSTWVHNVAAAASAAERIGGYPVVLKPAAHAGSVGVVRVDTITSLPAGWSVVCAAAAHQGPEGQGVLLEEVLDGPEISVATVTQHGVTTAVAVTHKETGLEPYFVETAQTVTADDPLLPTLAPVAESALHALGITTGVSHVEMRLTAFGPHLVEVNTRPGGDHISELIRYATGVDLVRAAASIACGQRPDLRPTQKQTAAIGMVHPPGPGTVTAREVLDGDDEHVEQFHWLCDVGDQVTLTPSCHTPNNTRAGFGIVTGSTAKETRARLAGLLDRAVVTVSSPVADAA
ncbi:ATP-grasp domain-containing protein [Streptomyces sp. NPDC050204]|uniref:ATP-grasp domain-containing protein n=1 Tax=Streptomyces sp. NPDC050204 TaxID=3155514 RepID=UPI0034485E6D